MQEVPAQAELVEAIRGAQGGSGAVDGADVGQQGFAAGQDARVAAVLVVEAGGRDGAQVVGDIGFVVDVQIVVEQAEVGVDRGGEAGGVVQRVDAGVRVRRDIGIPGLAIDVGP